MKKAILNGTPIPYEATLDELKAMISSPIMKDFSLACEALSHKNDREAYEIMKSYINDKDKYRRLYVLKTIFRYHQSSDELIDELENAIASDDFLFIESGLLIIADYQVKVSDSLLIATVDQYLPHLDMGISALKILDANENHYAKLVQLFKKAEKCIQKELISDILLKKYLPLKSNELFDLFRNDYFAKIRLLAVKLGMIYGYGFSEFSSDIDGHIRNAVK